MASQLDCARYSRSQGGVTQTRAFDWNPIKTAFLNGKYGACRAMLADAPDPRAQIWHARIDSRQGLHEQAIGRLLSLHIADRCTAAERDLWLGVAYQNTRDAARAKELLERGIPVLRECDAEQYYAAINLRVIGAYIEDDYVAAAPYLEEMQKAPSAQVRALAFEQTGWFRARRGDITGQLALMLQALDEYEQVAVVDQWLFANLLDGLASLCRELPSPGGAERVERALARVRNVEVTAYPRFAVQRALGWIALLNGEEFDALRFWAQAKALAPTPFWQVFCLIDRASLAQAMGRHAAAQQTLNAADRLASTLPWSQTQSEERVALMMLAALFAEISPGRAQRYLAMYRSLAKHMNPRLIFPEDPRAHAFHAYSQGVALLRLGEPEAGIGLLEDAWKIFTDFAHGWRAARAALDLYGATRASMWLERAREQIAPWPRSWIALEAEAASRSQR